MSHTRPKEDEFTEIPNGLRHEPTGAEFTAYTRERPLTGMFPSMLGSQLPDGRDYREHEVWEMAQAIWARSRR